MISDKYDDRCVLIRIAHNLLNVFSEQWHITCTLIIFNNIIHLVYFSLSKVYIMIIRFKLLIPTSLCMYKKLLESSPQ